MNNCRPKECARTQTNLCYDTLNKMVVAMAYVPWQYFENVFEPDAALCKGTIFPELYKPFTGRRGGGRRYE